MKKIQNTDESNNEITALKKIIEQQKNEIFQLKTIIDDLPGDVYWKHCVDKKLVYSGMNRTGIQSLQKMGFKWKKDDILGNTDDNLFDKETANTFVKNDLEVIHSGLESTKEEMAILPSGKKIIQLSTKRPLLDKAGNPIGIAGVSIDISELKETQAALQIALEKAKASDNAKTEFLENMRHDIRTPVVGIVGCAQLIQSQASNAAKVTEFANDLVESSDALLEFLNKVLESINVASGEIPLLKKKFDLYKLLEQIINLNKSYAVSKNLELNLVYDDIIPKYVIGDPIRVQRIVLELLTNALKFTEKGQIKVTACLRRSETKAIIIQLSVSDTGIGIPTDKQQAVYTRFKRLTPSYQGIYSGTGLGLSIVKQFMDDLDGEISLQSQPQQGSTFTCLIPFQEPLFMDSNDVEEIIPVESKLQKKVAVDESLVESSNPSGNRILVVEDQAIAAKIAQHVLTKLHYQVDVAEDGKMALAQIEQDHYDLILMDIGLPDNDGGEVTRRIRLKQWKRNPSVPIVGLTAHINAENKRRCIDAGMNAIYTKPLTPEKAAEIVTAFIPQHQKSTSPMVSGNSEPTDILKNLLAIDMERAIQFMGNIEFVKEGLVLLVSGLTKDLRELQQRHENNDWKAIKAMAHKWRGGAAYCGARRLEEACQQLETYLQSEPFEQAEAFYQQLIQEAEAAKEAAKTIIAE
ncbi:MAG: ATP-binding protein [Pseudomonadota bacterium]